MPALGMQLDIFDLIDNPAVKKPEPSQYKLPEEHREVMGMAEFEQIKAEKALCLGINDLPWKRWGIDRNSGDCQAKIIIPPNAISHMTYSKRFPGTRWDNQHRVMCQDIWAQYNHTIWQHKPYGVDWCGAFRILDAHRDSGEPLWVTIWLMGQHTFIPDCILEVDGL